MNAELILKYHELGALYPVLTGFRQSAMSKHTLRFPWLADVAVVIRYAEALVRSIHKPAAMWFALPVGTRCLCLIERRVTDFVSHFRLCFIEQRSPLDRAPHTAAAHRKNRKKTLGAGTKLICRDQQPN